MAAAENRDRGGKLDGRQWITPYAQGRRGFRLNLIWGCDFGEAVAAI